MAGPAGTPVSALGDWEQGSLLPAAVAVPTLYWAHPDIQGSKAAVSAAKVVRRERKKAHKRLPSLIQTERAPKPGERAMVLSHSCDLVKQASVMAQVEIARVFETTSIGVIAEAENVGSFRYYRLDGRNPDRALVLDYSWRTLIDKAALTAWRPDNALRDAWTPVQRKSLGRWLGRRSSRPAVSDREHDEICRPVQQRWQQLIETDAEEAAAFSQEYPEFRYGYDAAGRLVVYALSSEKSPNEPTWMELTDILREALQPAHPGVTFASDKRSYHSFTKADEMVTEQIDLMFSSQAEGEAIGALPA